MRSHCTMFTSTVGLEDSPQPPRTPGCSPVVEEERATRRPWESVLSGRSLRPYRIFSYGRKGTRGVLFFFCDDTLSVENFVLRRFSVSFTRKCVNSWSQCRCVQRSSSFYRGFLNYTIVYTFYVTSVNKEIFRIHF